MAKAFSSGLSSDLSGGADTIVARATPAGAGALAVIRVSGPETRRLAKTLCPELDTEVPWRAALVQIRDGQGDMVESAVAISYRAPRSFTGEDMLELMVHGSRWIVEAVVGAALGAGARQAEPGEFTRRAVANGKIDLVQAEAVNEIIQAETAWQARLAREQLHGVLSREFLLLKESLIAFLAEVEGSLDFEEQGVAVDHAGLRRSQDECLARIDALVATVGAGVRVREGARVVIVGEPNSGKSTLFNALLARERAIVAETPGTTRDVLEAELEVEGVPVVLVDTAGIRQAEDPAEAEGVKRARNEEARADVVVALYGADGGVGPPDEETGGEQRRLNVISKADLINPGSEGVLAISCVTGMGLERLRDEIHRRVAAPVLGMEGAAAINARHAEALARAREHLEDIAALPLEVGAREIRAALGALEEVLGTVDDEDVFDVVFSAFCVGK